MMGWWWFLWWGFWWGSVFNMESCCKPIFCVKAAFPKQSCLVQNRTDDHPITFRIKHKTGDTHLALRNWTDVCRRVTVIGKYALTHRKRLLSTTFADDFLSRKGWRANIILRLAFCFWWEECWKRLCQKLNEYFQAVSGCTHAEWFVGRSNKAAYVGTDEK